MPARPVPRPLAVAVVVVGLMAALVGVGPTPAQASPEGDLKAAVARLQAKIDVGAGRLEAATLRYERGRAALDRSLQTDLNAGFALDASRQQERQAQEAVNAFANSAYRQPMNPGVAGLLRGDLLAYHDFNVVQRGLNRTATDQRAVVKALQDSRTSAEALVVRTGASALAAQRAQVRLQAELEGLRVLASQDQVELTAAAAELETLRVLAARKAAALEQRRATFLPTAAGCSALPDESFANGFLPPGALCPLRDAPGQALQPAAAASFDALSAAYELDLGTALCVTDSYRDYASQVDVFRRKPSLAATPGRSRHGLGLAVDLCGGIQTFGSTEFGWMKQNAPGFGFVHPSWAEPGGGKPEAWHWEFGAADQG